MVCMLHRRNVRGQLDAEDQDKEDEAVFDVNQIYDQSELMGLQSTLLLGQVTHGVNKVLSPELPSDVQAMNDLHYYMPFALGKCGLHPALSPPLVTFLFSGVPPPRKELSIA